MNLFGSLEIGKKSLFAAQTGQSTTGHNIANVDTEGYSRQEVTQAAAKPTSLGEGTGVDVTGIRRIHDPFTKAKVIQETTSVGTWEAKAETLAKTEIVFTDLEGNGLRAALDEFWGAWSQVANEPEKSIFRKSLLSKSEQLSNQFQVLDSRLTKLRGDANSQIAVEISEVNALSKQLAKLNKQIQQIEDDKTKANDLRDQREVLLGKIAKRIDINWFENDRGDVEVQVANGHFLVHGREANLLLPRKSAGDVGMNNINIRTLNGQVYDITENIKEGSLKEAVFQRDVVAKKYQDNINQLAKELAFKVNQIHASGTGISSAKIRETSAYGLNKEAWDKPLPFLKSGEFEIKLVDDENEINEVISIKLEGGVDSLQSIVEKINKATGAYEKAKRKDSDPADLRAHLNTDGSITLFAANGNRFIFGKDETNVLPLLGFNTFFQTVNGAKDLRINKELVDNEMGIGTGYDLVPGDNRVALGIASLQFQPTMEGSSLTFDEYYNAQVVDVGLRVERAQNGEKNHKQMLAHFTQLRDAVSSVNVDEEMANMIKYQRAYEASAKFMTTIDQMTQTLVNM